MFIRKKTYYHFIKGLLVCLLISVSSALFAQQKDSAVILKKVTVTKSTKPNIFKSSIPAQSLNSESLQQINAQSIGDAARYFSGVLIKDYGGVGGLKTISVRSLGTSGTGILYDGIPVSNVQSGQIDLSRFSSTFVQSLQLFNANPSELLLPARTFASSSVLSIRSNTFYSEGFSKTKWQAGLKAGSFGLWQPSAAIYLPTGKHSAVSANAESVFSKGDYPFTIQNGNLSEKTNRNNSEVRSFQGEINFIKQFPDSSAWQTKVLGYTSKRGLPGAIIFFNNSSAQQLWNKDLFIQSRYEKAFNKATALLISAKYSNTYTRYTDPDFLNNSGGLDDRYTQKELYGSAALSHKFSENLSIAVASDASVAKLSANKENFLFPGRLTLWNSFSAKYSYSFFQINGTLLETYIHDDVRSGTSSSNKNKLTPMISLSVRPTSSSPFLIRTFYKEIFRMPTFNDLYYNFIGNTKLRPEYSSQYNLGISYSKFFPGNLRQFSFSADGYVNQIKDKIIAVPNQNLFTWTMLNVGKVQIKGVDITSETSGKFSNISGWFTRVAYTWQQAKDVTNPNSDSYKERIPYTPDHSGSALLIFHYQNWSAGYSVLFSGRRFTPGGNNYANQLERWTTHDISVSRILYAKNFKATIKAEAVNITNKQYDVVRYYPMPGRSFNITVNIQNP